ncbi:MAG: hypothetical protein HXX15_17850 [Rhodopseudomonas sp.]|nr:hypothetical protein [Rhodopseudomonas sp.]
MTYDEFPTTSATRLSAWASVTQHATIIKPATIRRVRKVQYCKALHPRRDVDAMTLSRSVSIATEAGTFAQPSRDFSPLSRLAGQRAQSA